jgi:uncharacterized protein DUF4333
MRARLAIALVLVSTSLVVTACGGEPNLDTSALESQIKKTLSDRTGIPIASVKCPDDVKPKKGAQFGCAAVTQRRERVLVRVTQEDDNGSVMWRVVQGPRVQR